MKATFSRWLPAIAQTNIRQTALVVAGLAIAGSVAAGPPGTLGQAAPVTSGVNPGAAAALQTAIFGDQPTRQPAERPVIAKAAGQPASQPATKPADQAAGQPASPPATKPADQAAGLADQAAGKPSMDRLIPHGTQGAQSRIELSAEQQANARAIVRTAKRTGVGERGAVIGVATSLQESKLENLGHLGGRNDHDSLGLFQQRPSSGWGSPDQITDPEYSATAFFTGLKRVDGWRDIPLTDAAQSVQVSAYPFAYAQWEQQAADIVHDVYGD